MLEEIVKRANFFDVLVVVIASVGIVGFWRGTWNLLDKYLYPTNFVISQSISITIGIIILILIAKYK